jgi:hypothetical protein
MDRRRTGSRSILSASSAGWKAWNDVGFQVHGIAYKYKLAAQVRDWEYVVISMEHGVCRVGPACAASAGPPSVYEMVATRSLVIWPCIALVGRRSLRVLVPPYENQPRPTR